MQQNFPKAAFFDVDGTLVPRDTRCISQADREAVEALHERGTLIFIVTGRHICEIDNIPFPVNGAVCNNGALTYVVDNGCARFDERDRFTLMEDHPIPKEQAIGIARIIVENRIPSAAVTATRTLTCHLTQQSLEFIRRVNMPEPREGDILGAADGERIYAFCPFVSPEEEKLLFKDVLGGLDTPRWCDEYCDITLHGMDKVLGIKKILGIFHISPEDIIAFGDGFNDIGMLEYAGCGIAMETADDAVRRAADCITASANDSGVSRWLRSI